MPGPIRPDAFEDPEVPEKVYQVFNHLIARNWDGYEAHFTVVNVTDLFSKQHVAYGDIFKGRLLVRGIVHAYREAGWVVEYLLKPLIGPGWFTFSKRRY